MCHYFVHQSALCVSAASKEGKDSLVVTRTLGASTDAKTIQTDILYTCVLYLVATAVTFPAFDLTGLLVTEAQDVKNLHRVVTWLNPRVGVKLNL